MILASTQSHSQDAFVRNHPSLPRASTSPFGSHPSLATQSTPPTAVNNPMERSVPEYSQSGLPSPYPSTYGDTQSEASSADHASAAQYPTPQEARPSNYSASATPTSEYGAYAHSARSSSSFPEHSLRQYHPAASNPSGSSGGMAQTPTSPSMPMQDGRNHQSQQVKSDSDMPIDPSIAAPSPTYGHSQYSTYPAPPPQDMSHSYPQSAGSLYAQPRPDWANYGHPGQQMPPHHVFPHTPTSAPPARGQVGSLYFPQHSIVSQIAQCAFEETTPSISYKKTIRKIADFCVDSMVDSKYIHSYLSPAHNSIKDRGDDMKRSSACTSADGTAVRRLTVL